MPSIDWTTQSASDYHFKQRTVGKQLKFTLIPRLCHITKRRIWLEFAYCVTAMYRSGDINFSYEHRWYNKDEYLIARLKDII
jgi:hypothetical protein